MKAKRALESQKCFQASRGNPGRGGKLRHGKTVSTGAQEPVQLHKLVHNKSVIGKVHDSLDGFLQRNATYELQKAVVIKIMVTALLKWNCTILEAARYASDCCGFNTETVRLWAASYISLASACTVDEINDDEVINDVLESNRGQHENYSADSLMHNKEFCLTACTYIRSRACRKGEPNLTSKMFAEWVEREYETQIHDSTACRWMQQLGFSRVHHQKGIYFDGHDRDVVAYRHEYLINMKELDKKSITCFGNVPQVAPGEKPLIRVTHDECTYYANCDQSYFWADDHTNVLRQKSLGTSIMVSYFVDEVIGFLRDDRGEARVLLETSREGYFTNEHLFKQVENGVDIFERVHPEAKGIFIFDNAPSHRKMADDALNANRMNVGPGGKQPVMKDTIWGGQIQKMVDENGIPRGMRARLEERGVSTVGMKAKEMRDVLKSLR